MACNVHLFLTLLALSSLVSSSTFPITCKLSAQYYGALLHLGEKEAIISPEVTSQANQGGHMKESTKEAAFDELSKYRRMDFEFTSNDFPGLGANDLHTPHSQLED